MLSSRAFLAAALSAARIELLTPLAPGTREAPSALSASRVLRVSARSACSPPHPAARQSASDIAASDQALPKELRPVGMPAAYAVPKLSTRGTMTSPGAGAEGEQPIMNVGENGRRVAPGARRTGRRARPKCDAAAGGAMPQLHQLTRS